MDVWEVPQSSRSGLDRGFLMDVGPTRARYTGMARLRVTENRKSDTVPQRGRVPRLREPMLLLVGTNSNLASRH
jgi:hypothetical protein